MSIRDGKAKADQVLGRVEEILASYADPAAEIHGEAMRLRGEAEQDADLRARVLEALVLDSEVLTSVHAHVRNGLATLTGTADYRYQRDAAEEASRAVTGVVDVANEVELTDTTQVPAGVQNQIRSAFVRKAKLDADRPTVLASEGTVTLRGRVGSRDDRDVAVAAARAAPGVHAVDDRLTHARCPALGSAGQRSPHVTA